MRFKLLTVIVISLFVLIIINLIYSNAASSNIQIPLNSSYWWQGNVSISGTANYTNGTAIPNSNFNLWLDNVLKCTGQTDSQGQWYCNFTAPNRLGSYTVNISITDAENVVHSKLTTLYVKAKYGETPIGSVDRSVYESPMLIQDLDGSIRQVWARVTVWRYQ